MPSPIISLGNNPVAVSPTARVIMIKIIGSWLAINPVTIIPSEIANAPAPSAGLPVKTTLHTRANSLLKALTMLTFSNAHPHAKYKIASTKDSAIIASHDPNLPITPCPTKEAVRHSVLTVDIFLAAPCTPEGAML